MASKYFGLSGIATIFNSIFHTCSLSALPLPVMACFILRGEYSVTGMPKVIAAAMATPCALPSLSMLCTFLPKKGASIAKVVGLCMSINSMILW